MPETAPSPRLRIKRQRAALPPAAQRHLAQQMVRRVRASRLFRNAKTIALYLPVRGEADPSALRNAARPHQRFYLPVLSPFRDGRLWFVEWDDDTRFRDNRFRIPEPYPRHRKRRPARCLDLVITPLVAFDHQGTRMGMGGGFYDRSFAFKRRQLGKQRPHLLGYAYAFQKLPDIPRQPWDVPLDAAVTEIDFQQF